MSFNDGSAPLIADAHLSKAIACVRQRNLEAARRHAEIAAQQATPDWPDLETLGIVLFHLSRFPAAHRAIIQASQNRALGKEALTILSALYCRNRQFQNARSCIAAMSQLSMIESPGSPHPGRPNVLRLRSLEKSHFGIKTNRKTGLRYCLLQGGHFSTKNLIDWSRFNRYVGTLTSINLMRAATLPAVDLVVNCVSCPDLDPLGLNNVEAFLTNYPNVPVINHPCKVRRTTRAENARRLGSLPHVIVPQTELFLLDGLAAAIAAQVEATGLGYPLIVRHRGTQTGKTVEKIDNRIALVEWVSAQPPGTEVYASAFFDCRWQDGFYHKIRVFFIDGELFPVASLASDSWQIHSGDRYRIMSSTPSTQEDEHSFLNDPSTYLGSKALEALYAIRDTIELDFFGIDFTIDSKGDVFVFEANAAMRHNYDHAVNFSYTRPYLERVSEAFTAMIERHIMVGRSHKKPSVIH